MTQKDGISFLLDQHRQIEELIAAVSGEPVADRQARFDELRELLAVHETAEELILRPVTRAEVPGGDTIADARIAEENQSKDTLAELEKLDATSTEFATLFASFADDVKQHAHNEETLEFPLVEEHQDQQALKQMSQRLQAAEKIAPTHPHPSARSTTANLVLGPFAAIVDRVRDAISSL
jgi:iron-sulfur cluster repair protein YtfE (RIC family)